VFGHCREPRADDVNPAKGDAALPQSGSECVRVGKSLGKWDVHGAIKGLRRT